MRPPVRRRLHPYLRLGLALALAGAFGFRAAAAPATWACLHGGTEGVGLGHAGHGGHQGGDSRSPMPACVCIAHAAGMTLPFETPRLRAVVAPPQPAVLLAVGELSPLAAERHRLPYSIGPPALLA